MENEYQPDGINTDGALIAWIFGSCVLAVIILLIVFWPGISHADSVPRERAVNAIIGEAEGEGARGMLAVACAIRNRGTLRGVYGEHAPRVTKKKYSNKIYLQAVDAWDKSSDVDNCKFIDGADHWEGTKFRIPKWAQNMRVTATIGNQRFYAK